MISPKKSPHPSLPTGRQAFLKGGKGGLSNPYSFSESLADFRAMPIHFLSIFFSAKVFSTNSITGF
jgi:hypothetical protein